MLSIPLAFSQVPASSTPFIGQSERLSELSRWFVALDGFLADTTVDTNPKTGYEAWVKWYPASRLSLPVAPLDLATPLDLASQLDLPGSLETPTAEPARLFKDSAQHALNELSMVSFGASSREDGLIPVSQLPIFTAAAATLLATQEIDTLIDAAELHNGANPLRVILSFLASLNIKDREDFRLLAGIDRDAIFRLLDVSRMHNQAQGAPVYNQTGSEANQADSSLPSGTLESRQVTSASRPADLLSAERLLVMWRSSRLRSAQFQQGSLSHAVARAEAGKHLAYLLDTEYGTKIFDQGWAGERFAQDAKKDLTEAWSAIGRAVAVDLRREAAPWLARRLETTTNPSFNLEYTVRPSPSNPYIALMTMRAVVNGVSYGIPYQTAARALASAASAFFDDAPIPLRYVEEPLPGLRIYVPRNGTDSARAVAHLSADLSAAYPGALRVPSSLVHIPLDAKSSCEEVCIALDGAYREAATGARLARSFVSRLRTQGYPVVASLILHDPPLSGDRKPDPDVTDGVNASNEKGEVDL